MRQIYFITKRELTGYFFSPIAYVFICIFLLLLVKKLHFKKLLSREYFCLQKEASE